MIKNKWKMSASLMSGFKACAYRTYMRYVMGIVADVSSDSQRQGTTWHRILEIMGMKGGSVCPDCANKGQKDTDCPLCGGTDLLPLEMIHAVIRHLKKAYANKPVSKTDREWYAEYAKLLYSVVGYNWYYSEDEVEVIAEEIKFEVEIKDKETGVSIPGVTLVGMIDKLIRRNGGPIMVEEHKSTADPIGSDSSYWSHLKLDTQISAYVYAARQLQLSGKLEEYGVKATDPLITGVLYDVWHKPAVKPKGLTIAESKRFLQDAEYMGSTFEVVIEYAPGDNPPMTGVKVNGMPAELTSGAKEGTFKLRETAEMYGTRLLQEISNEPEKYFVRKDIARTDNDIERFERELISIHQTIQFMNRNNSWYHNEHQCEATFKCPYVDYCYSGTKPDPKNLLPGYKLLHSKKDKDKK